MMNLEVVEEVLMIMMVNEQWMMNYIIHQYCMYKKVASNLDYKYSNNLFYDNTCGI